MPVHDFISDDGETISVYVSISAAPEAHRVQEQNGKTYKRVYSAPLAATDLSTLQGDGTKDDFYRVTTGKRGMKVGDLWEISQSMSERRKDKQGFDPVREEHYKKHERETGEKHPDVIRQEKAQKLNERMKEMGIKVKI